MVTCSPIFIQKVETKDSVMEGKSRNYFHPVDYAILSLSLVISVLVGIYQVSLLPKYYGSQPCSYIGGYKNSKYNVICLFYNLSHPGTNMPISE